MERTVYVVTGLEPIQIPNGSRKLLKPSEKKQFFIRKRKRERETERERDRERERQTERETERERMWE